MNNSIGWDNQRLASLYKFGFLLMLITLLIFLIIGFLLNVPDKHTAMISISSDINIQDLKTRDKGRVKLLKKDLEKVRKGELLAFVQEIDSADILSCFSLLNQIQHQKQDIIELKKILTRVSIDHLPAEALQVRLLSIKRILRDIDFLTDKQNLRRSKIANREHWQKREMATSLGDSMISNLSQTNALAKARYKITRKLHSEKVVSDLDLINSELSLQSTEVNSQVQRLYAVQNKITLEDELETLQYQVAEDSLSLNTRNADFQLQVEELIIAISVWIHHYVFIAEYDGTLYINHKFGNDYLAGEIIARLLPNEGSALMGRIEIPKEVFFKMNGKTNIQLEFSFNEKKETFIIHDYKLSDVPFNDQYLVLVKVPNEVLTIADSQNLVGLTLPVNLFYNDRGVIQKMLKRYITE